MKDLLKFLLGLPLRVLLWVGLVRRRDDGTIHWPVRVAPWHCWVSMWEYPRLMFRWKGSVYVFRNLPGVIKWEKGRLLPRRWGIGFFGLVEFGDRG